MVSYLGEAAKQLISWSHLQSESRTRHTDSTQRQGNNLTWEEKNHVYTTDVEPQTQGGTDP